MCLAPEAVRLVLGAQPGQIGTDLRTSELGDVLVAGALNPLGYGLDIRETVRGLSPSASLVMVNPFRALLRGRGPGGGAWRELPRA